MDESVNFAKGYTKVNPSELNNPNLPHRKATQNRRIAVLFSLILLLTVIIGTVIAVLVYKSTTEPPEPSSSPSVSSSKPDESIKSVCSVTRYPDPCVTSISSIIAADAYNNNNNKPDPEHIFNVSLQVAVNELANLSSLPKTLISTSNDQGTESALRDCASLFTDALSQLNNSMEAMRVGPGEKVLTEERINDLKTWISGAMSDQETCLDGLEEMESSVLKEVKVKVERCKEYMSNSLAILANILPLLDKFGLTMH